MWIAELDGQPLMLAEVRALHRLVRSHPSHTYEAAASRVTTSKARRRHPLRARLLDRSCPDRMNDLTQSNHAPNSPSVGSSAHAFPSSARRRSPDRIGSSLKSETKRKTGFWPPSSALSIRNNDCPRWAMGWPIRLGARLGRRAGGLRASSRCPAGCSPDHAAIRRPRCG